MVFRYYTAMAGKWDAGAATPAHTPHGRGYNQSLNYFSHKNDFWSQVRVLIFTVQHFCSIILAQNCLFESESGGRHTDFTLFTLFGLKYVRTFAVYIFICVYFITQLLRV